MCRCNNGYELNSDGNTCRGLNSCNCVCSNFSIFFLQRSMNVLKVCISVSKYATILMIHTSAPAALATFLPTMDLAAPVCIYS